MASPLVDFINLFTPPEVVQAQQEQAAQQATFRELEKLLGGPQPFEQDLFPGESPIPGLQTITQPGSQQDIVRTLIRSGSSGLAQQGLEGLKALVQGQQQQDLAAKARNALAPAINQLRSQPGVTPAQQVLASFAETGNSDALKALFETLKPTTISSGQTRLGAFGQALATGQEDPTKKRDSEEKLRKEYLGQTERFAVVDESMSSIKSLAEVEIPTTATDNSLLFMYARILSPGIVTKEDFENAKRSGGAGLPGQARIYFQQMKNGLLPEEARKNIAQAAAVQYLGQRNVFQQIRKDYKDLSLMNSLDPDAVIGTRKARTNIDKLLNSITGSNLPPAPAGYK